MNGDPPSRDEPPVLQRVRAGPRAPAGPADVEVTAAAAIAAGLPYQGPLATDAPLRLLYLAASASASGRLSLVTERGRFDLQLKRGVVEHAESDARDDALGPFLVARGMITAGALAAAERIRGDHGGDLVSALASLRELNPAHAYAALQDHGKSVVVRAVGARQGTCRWEPGAASPPSAFPLGSRWGILCDAARRLDGAVVRHLLGDRARRVAHRSRGRVELSQLNLTAHEARAAAMFDGASSPLQLVAAHGPESEAILATALLLAETELLAFGALAAGPETPRSTGAPAAERAPTTERAAAPPRPREPIVHPVTPPRAAPVHEARREPAATPAPPAAAGAANQEELQALHARLAAADHFDALGVKRDATTAQIKAAYFQLARRYHPDAAPAGEAPEVRKLRADVFARLSEAWRTLGDDAGRAEYARRLESGGAVELDVSAILKAEEIFRKATIQMKARQYAAALAALEEAAALNPEEPEFAVWTAWVRFLLAPDRDAQYVPGAAAIEDALKRVPRCLPGYLFLAQMAKLMGDLDAARRHLERGLALDPNAADLVRELRYLRK